MNDKTIIGFCFRMLYEKSKLDQGQIDGQGTLTYLSRCNYAYHTKAKSINFWRF